MASSLTPTADTPDPSGIMQLATGYWASATLLAANDLGVFGALADAEQTAAQVGNRLGVDGRAVERLLNACCALGLVTRRGPAYRLCPAAAAFLVPYQPGYLGAALRWSHQQYPLWARLAESVRTGGPLVEPELHLGRNREQTQAFVLAMHERAKGVARGVVEFLDLDGCATAFDVGGGPGTYAALLARKYPGLQVTVLDLPGVVTVARELVTEEHVRFQAGDATEADYGAAAYDAVLFCGVLHQFSPPTIERMLAGAACALRDGGRVIVCDVMSDDTGTQPPFAALFSLQMLLTSDAGGVFASSECAAWLTAAGFVHAQVQRLPEPLPYTVIQARKLHSKENTPVNALKNPVEPPRETP